MVKDYFQDIMPPSGEAGPRRLPQTAPKIPNTEERDEGISSEMEENPPQPRGIRSISAPMRNRQHQRSEIREIPGASAPRAPRGRPGWLIWVAAALSLVVLLGLVLFALRSTTVSVIPKSQVIVFGQTSEFTAYPADSAATGTLSYTVQTIDLEDSQVVPAQGTTTIPASKATGNIVVFNDYSTASVHLIKNTRFETPEGLVYRVPADVVIPGKKGTTPGQVSITVAADSPGEKYNIGPVSRFTLPGLKNSVMYTGVYARSTQSMTGGASAGSGPAIAPSDLTAAIAEVRGRLETKTRDAVRALTTDSVIAFADMANISYQDLPRTVETGGGVRIHESAHLTVPVFPADLFASAVGAQVSADAGNASLKLIPGEGFAAHVTASSNPTLGMSPLSFTLAGQGMLVWNVDASALASALAGRESSAFQAIVNNFPGIQEAHARIEPFWKSSFPADPSKIKIDIQEPATTR